MKLPDFELERYFAEYEFKTRYLLCCSDCESMTISDLLSLDAAAAAGFGEVWLGYTEAPGHPDLRNAAAGLYDRISPGQVLVHSGAEEAIFNFMNAVLESGDHIIVQYPGYQSLYSVARSIGCDVSLWAMDFHDGRWTADMGGLESLIRPGTRAVVVNSPHNPTGHVLDRTAVDRLVNLADRHGFFVFSDEVYRLLEYDDTARVPPLADLTDRALSLGVMSKSFGLAGLRIGWIATQNADIYRRMAAFKDYTTICSAAPSEFLSVIALRRRSSIVGRIRGIIGENLNLLDEFFQRWRGLFEWERPLGGPIAFPALKKSGNAAAFCADLVDKAGVLLLPGSVYGSEYASHFRIGFGRKNMAECLEKLNRYLEEKSD